jgi:hypothetical protein
MTDDPLAFVNGHMWKSPTSGTAILQWLDADSWMLLATFQTREGWPGLMPVTDPDGSGKYIYTGAEIKQRLMRWKPMKWNAELGWQ